MDTTSQPLDTLLAALERCKTPEARARIAEALVDTDLRDDRILASLVTMLADDPLSAAENLAAYGDERAVPELLGTLGRLTREPLSKCDICTAQQLTAVAAAIEVLGGELTADQFVEMDAIIDRADVQWVCLGDPRELPPVPEVPARRRRLPRNAPCHCGSGRKYKKCHLDADEASARH